MVPSSAAVPLVYIAYRYSAAVNQIAAGPMPDGAECGRAQAAKGTKGCPRTPGLKAKSPPASG